MHIASFPEHVGWFDGKGVDFHPLGSRSNPHEWHTLWSMLEC
jgi:hypothetical protein